MVAEPNLSASLIAGEHGGAGLGLCRESFRGLQLLRGNRFILAGDLADFIEFLEQCCRILQCDDGGKVPVVERAIVKVGAMISEAFHLANGYGSFVVISCDGDWSPIHRDVQYCVMTHELVDERHSDGLFFYRCSHGQAGQEKSDGRLEKHFEEASRILYEYEGCSPR